VRLQPIYDIAQICSLHGVTDVVLCPGSRCAPLTLAFSRHPKINTKTISDERSAAFISLGIAQQTNSPVAMVCTSGSAAYNFAPAVAEAFFAETPLLIFTADRPAEWIAQHDGQTIHQSEIFGKHIKQYYQLPQDYEHPDSVWAINRMVNEAINLSQQEPKGPVHINIPLREPLYPAPTEVITYSKDIRIIKNTDAGLVLTGDLLQDITTELKQFNNILVVAGQCESDDFLLSAVESFSTTYHIPVIGDIISNFHPNENTIRHADSFLAHTPAEIKEALRPDLLITFGKSVISKNLKLFLRQYTPKAHWHIQPHGNPTDPFQSITKTIHITPTSFFYPLRQAKLLNGFELQKQQNFQKLWEIEERRTQRILHDFFPQEKFGELELAHEIIKNLPENSTLHLANSMSVRYANIIGLSSAKAVDVYANRGTSGIDGCTSTTVGHALTSKLPQILITGDLAFFYDRNAFWHNYPIPNLRIVLLNNHGGIIFKMIDGPGALPEADEYFVTRQKLNAKKLCEEFDFDYLLLDNKRKIKNTIKEFFEFDGRTKILELESSIELNKNIFESLKQKIKKSYEL
jgi:2-succinyl-5-enolpyruvyl-6-hydroxy-3-cyclohexene-1-carboxylate synthase